MVQILKFAGFMLVLLAILPLAGFCVTGSWRQAWEYTRTWLRSMAWLLAVSAFAFIAAMQLIPPPN